MNGFDRQLLSGNYPVLMHQTGAIGTYDIFCTRIHVTFHLVPSHLSSTGIDNGDLNNEKIVTVPLDTDETMLVGWITNERAKLSKAAETYLEKLKSVVASHGYTLID